MRLLVMGQQVFGKAALDRLLNDGTDEVVAVYCAPDREGRPVDPLKEAALEAGITVEQPPNFKDGETLERMRSYSADLMIMAYVTLFVPKAAREIPELGSICFHPSLLPLHRGPSSINWPIIWGSEKTGFSWFYPTDGLDEGDILLQRECMIDPDDTLGNVYFKKIFPEAIESLPEVCELFRSGNPPRIAQDDSKATYESWCRSSDARIDWSRPVGEVYNLIRGTNPQPGAWTTFNGARLQIFDCQKLSGLGNPGTIAEVSEDGFVVQSDGGRIAVRRVRPEGGKKMPAAEWLNGAAIVSGAALGE